MSDPPDLSIAPPGSAAVSPDLEIEERATMAGSANYSASIARAEKGLTIAAAIAVLAGGLIGRFVPHGAVLAALGLMAVLGGLFGMALNASTRNPSGRAQRILYPVMSSAGVIALVVFFAVRGRNGSPDIGPDSF